MQNTATTEEIVNFWSHAPNDMTFGHLMEQRREERAAWCATVAGPVAVEAVAELIAH